MNNRTLKRYLPLGLLGMSALPGQLFSDVITGEEEQTGLGTWEWRRAGISIQLIQRLPDQTRAFFQGRGFTPEDADTIARACVFQTIFRNDGTQPLTYDLNDWQIAFRGKRLPVQTRERWEEQWQAGGVDQAARIAFRWSLLPTVQGFEPGDYNWGMTSFGLPPGASFDLSVMLTIDREVVTDTIPAIVCAADQP